MALGKRRDGGNGGNFLPIIKFDGNVGTFCLQDRVHSDGGWQTEQRDVTGEFQAIFDLENLQRGWIRFQSGAAPDVKLVRLGEDPGDPPSDGHKEGVRIVLKMADDLGGDVRELMSTARGLWNAVDTLHDRYLAAVASHPGELPVVTLDTVREVKTGAGTTFVPVFSIADWVPRAPELTGDPLARSKAQGELPLTAKAAPAVPPKPTAGTVRRARPAPAPQPVSVADDMDDEIPFLRK
jgi:hypothetical protein